nr:MAG TPA: Type II secretion system, protein M [Caudoviricetes sp.]
MWFLNVKFLLSVGGALLIALGGAGLEIWRLNGALSSAEAETQNIKDKLEKEQTKLALKEAESQIYAANLGECNMRIDLQNEKIKALSVKPPDVVKTQELVVTKFQKIEVPVKDAQCEKKLKFYEELINEAGK